ncbi:NAD(P)-binding protein [Lentinula guzmanii]|uniref:NAD(P)-binding protein n=1 Tax=Lentinula guzmanii TaxID=2804957 RepID=A0AA38JJ11_9AGAR|nr:NAD(P)-binding protein [Lentinula guzmanii]
MDPPRVWFITGTSSGFGRRLVPSILRRGDKVIATARNIQSLHHIFPPTDNLQILELDISSDEATIKLKAQQALTFWGKIDVLVNNAGYSLKILVEDATLADFQTQFQTNFYGPAALTNALLPQMRSRKEGTVVMIGSRSSWNPIPALSIYAASKAALRVYSETLAQELSASRFPNIRLLIVEPSGFRTEQNVLGYPMQVPTSPDPAYDSLRARIQANLEALDLNQSGDPDKAVELIVDVVRGEGQAEGKDWSLYLPLGRDANQDIGTKCGKMLTAVKTWREVTDHLDIE